MGGPTWLGNPLGHDGKKNIDLLNSLIPAWTVVPKRSWLSNPTMWGLQDSVQLVYNYNN